MLKRILTHIIDFFNVEKHRREFEDAYLNSATSIVDLEQRMRNLDNMKTNRWNY